ncbi:MAG: hypothetical protein OEL20_15425 [Sulfuritalea sp.]|nr:hypothetical protein [Sulfuritalea sp.]
MAPCGGDPSICIDFAVLFIAEYLKEWTTLSELLLLLGLLLKLRADRRKAAEDAYATQLGIYADKRSEEAQYRH